MSERGREGCGLGGLGGASVEIVRGVAELCGKGAGIFGGAQSHRDYLQIMGEGFWGGGAVGWDGDVLKGVEGACKPRAGPQRFVASSGEVGVEVVSRVVKR